jgi:hypothetical protein
MAPRTPAVASPDKRLDVQADLFVFVVAYVNTTLTRPATFRHWKRESVCGRQNLQPGCPDSAFRNLIYLSICAEVAARQVIKQPRLPRLQRSLLLAKEVSLRLALSLPLRRVAIKRLVGNRLLAALSKSAASSASMPVSASYTKFCRGSAFAQRSYGFTIRLMPAASATLNPYKHSTVTNTRLLCVSV